MKNPISYKLLLVFICFQLNLTAQTELPNRKVLLYTQYEAVGERGTYRDYSLIKRVTLGINLSPEKRKKIENAIKKSVTKGASDNISIDTRNIKPNESFVIVRVKYNAYDNIYHRFKIIIFKEASELEKKLEDLKYWAYKSHEVVYEEASLTSMKDTDDFYNEMLDYFKSFFEKDDKDKEKLIKDYKDGFTGTRG